ncbi:hypothetical protein CC86DRAFT_18694 [Ophiobolus disseminans]|uniref:Uncharacterized protein n=1 Tax=Ophiobolus disseminans TaxID=1469910 RepID=A0A6A7A0E8_9PLEO|nr:hypothetical protein CC86DRAFT_18694 [Ophiobolus disseminans]
MSVSLRFHASPCVARSAEDKSMRKAYIESVEEECEDDDWVEFNDKYIKFKEGEHPRLPMEGHNSLRFSSQISGRTGQEAEEYIDGSIVLRRALAHVCGVGWNCAISMDAMAGKR